VSGGWGPAQEDAADWQAALPRRYGPSVAMQVVQVLLAVASGLVALGALLLCIVPVGATSPASSAGYLILYAVAALALAWRCCNDAVYSQVTLLPQGICQRTFRGERQLDCRDIAGFRYVTGKGRWLELYAPTGKVLMTIPITFKPDATFEQWLAALPSGMPIAKPITDTSLLVALLIYLLPALGVAAAFSSVLMQQLLFAPLALLPGVALLLARCWPVHFQLAGREGSGRAELAPAMLLSGGLACTLLLVTPYPGLAWYWLAAAALLPTLLLIALAAALLPEVRRIGGIALLLASLLPYCTALLIQANVIFASGTPQLYPVTVDNTYLQHSRGVHVRLVLGAWGSEPAGDDLAMPRELIGNVGPGDKLCVAQYQGALGLGWYEAGRVCASDR
jgi:hypothetical protein